MKKILFIGIILLIAGIIIKKVLLLNLLGLILIITGVTCKAFYIITKVKTGEYKPGKEVIFLVVGLSIFFTGIYFQKINYSLIEPIYLIVLGLSLKVIFIILFIKEIKANKG